MGMGRVSSRGSAESKGIILDGLIVRAVDDL